MNVHLPIADATDANMTSKGQVLIPKPLRERAGLVPGGGVTIGVNDQGDVVVRPRHAAETPEQRVARIRAGIERLRGTATTGTATADAVMDDIRPWRHDP
jgi:antitoxin PrlF